MSNVIGFLEQAGRDAAMRHASREQLMQAMQQGVYAHSSLDSISDLIPGGVREKMYCMLLTPKPPKKAPPKKKPGKAPPKKKPAKKKPAKKTPAKKTPAKKKR